MSTGQPAPRPLGPREVLRNREFLRVWLAQAISDLGDGLTSLTLLILVTRLTGSTAALAAMAISIALPTIVVGPIAGVFVDRWDRRRVMLAADLLRAVIVLGFVIAAVSGQLLALYALAFVEASVAAFFSPARSALVPRIVPPDGLMAANSLNQLTRVIATVTGGAAAGILVGATDVSWPAFVVDAATFVVSFALVLRVARDAGRVHSGASTAGGDVIGELRSGIALVLRSRILLGTMIGAGVTMLGVGAINVLFVPFLVRDLALPVTWLGFVDGAQTAAMVLAAGTVAMLAARARPTTLVVLSLLGVGIAIGLVGAVQSVWQVAVLLFVAGWFVTPLEASLLTIVQIGSTDAYRGRVSSTLHSVMAAANVTSMGLAGVFGDLVGVRPVFAIGGGVIVAAAAAAAVLYAGAVPIGAAAHDGAHLATRPALDAGDAE